MVRSGTRAPELAIPVASLAALRQALSAEVGPDAAAEALRAAGNAAGDAWHAQLTHDEQVSQTTFWRRLKELFSSRGWGTLVHSAVHPGVGALDANDWVEAVPEASARFASTGLRGILA